MPSDQDSQTNAGCRAGFDIAYFVPGDRAMSRIEPEVRNSLQDHSRLGFTPGMIATIPASALQGVIRTMIDSCNCRAFRFKAAAHPLRQLCIGVLVEVAAADTGLIGNDNDRASQLIGPETSEFENSGNELELLPSVDVAAIDVNNTVPVQKQSAAMHGLKQFHTIKDPNCRFCGCCNAPGSDTRRDRSRQERFGCAL